MQLVPIVSPDKSRYLTQASESSREAPKLVLQALRQKFGSPIIERILYHVFGITPKSTGLRDTIRELLFYPNLAAKVRHLHLALRANNYVPHDGYSQEALSYTKWKEEARKGSDIALAGLLPTLLPKLEYLEVRLYKQCDSQEAPESWMTADEGKLCRLDVPIAIPSINVAAEMKHKSLHLLIYGLFRESPVVFHTNRTAALYSLTSISSPTLLPWKIMCLPNLRQVTIGPNIHSDGCFQFDLPKCAQIPKEHAEQSGITSLAAQVPIEFLNIAISEDRVFGYLPTVLRYAPALKRLALHITRELGNGPCPGNDIKRSYRALVRSLRSTSLEELIIDTCNIDSSAVRKCTVDFFESIHPMNSLHGLPCLRRIAAPQEAFIRVEGSLTANNTTSFVAPKGLLPDTIETIEIIDSTSSLNTWAMRILDAWGASTLSHLSGIVLWCDRWYPTLVPDYRTDEWYPKPPYNYPVAGRGGRENDLLASGLYGEYPGFEDYKPAKEDEALMADMRTGVRLQLDMLLDSDDESSEDELMELDAKQAELMQPFDIVWSMLEEAGVKVEKRPDEERGWRR